MRIINTEEAAERTVFAKEAARHFAKNSHRWTYSSAEIVAGCLFAVKFGGNSKSVVVFRLSDDEVEVYQDIIGEEEPF